MSKTVGNLFVKLALDSTKFTNDVHALQRAANKMSREITRDFKALDRAAEPFKRLGIAAAATATAITYAAARTINSVVKQGDAFADMSKQTGISTERLSEMAFAAQLVGTDIDGVQRGMRALVANMTDVSRGTGTARKTFEELGIRVALTDGSLRSSTDVMFDVADALAKVKNETQPVAYVRVRCGSWFGQ